MPQNDEMQLNKNDSDAM